MTILSKAGVISRILSKGKIRQSFIALRLQLHGTLTWSPRLNCIASDDMNVELIDVRGRFVWHVTGVFKGFICSRVHITKCFGTLLKRKRICLG